MNVSDVKDLADAHARGDRQGGGRPGRHRRSDADRAVGGGHILLEGPPGTAKTFLAQCFARTLGAGLRPHPVHARPDAGRHHRRQPVQLPDLDLHADARADLLRAAAGRRDQPHAAQDPGRAAGGDAGAQRHHRRPGPPAQRALHGGGDPEPDRAAGHLSAAGGPARPLPVQADPGAIPTQRGGARHRRRARRANRQPGPGRPRRRPSPPTARRSTAAIARSSPACGWPTRWSTISWRLVRATRETPTCETGASPRSARDAGHRGARPGGAARAATT